MIVSATVTSATVRKMQAELDQFEAQARRELDNKETSDLGILRMELVAEFRRRLLFISFSMRTR
jgi:hypothetical protein